MNLVPTMYVMVGLPGVGKTTHARAIQAEKRALRLTPDEWMIPLFAHNDAGGKRDVLEGRLVSIALEALRLGVSVVLDFGVWSRDERSALRWLAGQAEARCELVYLSVTNDEQRRRIAARFANEAEASYELAAYDVDRFDDLFQIPGPDELSCAAIDDPPAGHDSWESWAVERWPSLVA